VNDCIQYRCGGRIKTTDQRSVRISGWSGAPGVKFLCCLLSLLLAECGSAPPREGPPPSPPPLLETGESVPPGNGGNGGEPGIPEEIRNLTENGSPPSLLRALDLIRSRDALSTDFGRVMTAVDVTLMQKLYPAIQTQLPQPDPPQTNTYTRILREAERGTYIPPPASSQDYLECVLPFLALYQENRPERLLPALPALQRAVDLRSDSVLAPYFIGLIYERSNRIEEARIWYQKAYQVSPECYPASLGLARIMETQGNTQEALKILSDLVIRFPDNLDAKRQLARTYYQAGEWSRAERAIAEILQRDSRDREFILLRAQVLVEMGQFLQAQTPLDLYASLDPNNRLYLYLRARVQAEGYHNRDAALTYLRSLLRSSPEDDAATVYAVRLLLESSRPADQNEGRGLLQRLLRNSNPSPGVISLALQDAIRRQDLDEARSYLNRLLEERRSQEDLLAAYLVEKGQGNNAAALSFARELYEANPSNNDNAVTYISALIDTGRQEEAGRMIESRLAGISGGSLKSRYYYLRSRIRNNEDSRMNDLRSSLFEDPRNLDAIIDMFEIYHRRKDESRALFYLKQALALSPDDPRLKNYQAEYASTLGTGF